MIIRLAELATFLKVEKQTIRRMVARGEINVTRVGKLICFKYDEVQRVFGIDLRNEK